MYLFGIIQLYRDTAVLFDTTRNFSAIFLFFKMLNCTWN